MTYDLTEAHLKTLEFIITSGSYMETVTFYEENIDITPSKAYVLPMKILEMNLENLISSREDRPSSYDEFIKGYGILQTLILDGEFTKAFNTLINLRLSLQSRSELGRWNGDSSLRLAIHSILIKWTDSFLGSIESIEEANKRVLMSSLDYRLSN